MVDAALAVTGCERGFLLLRKDEDLEVSPWRATAKASARCARSARAHAP